MKLQWFTFSFEQFSTYQLYEVLALRSQVFVVEQNCVYQDIDGADQKALHICAYDMQDNSPVLVAYARIFNAGIKFAEAAIGRVLTHQNYRDKKLGHLLLQQSLTAIQENFGAQAIRIGAQTHLEKFYMKYGFVPVGASFLEDGIEHTEMLRAI